MCRCRYRVTFNYLGDTLYAATYILRCRFKQKGGTSTYLLDTPSIKQCYVPLVERIGRNKAVGIAQLLLVGLKVGHGDIAHDVVVLLG